MVKILNKDIGQRMWGGNGGSGSVGGGLNKAALAGYATQAWVNQKYLSIEFFSKLFQAYGPGASSGDPDVAVNPNDTESTISHIKAMFGFWTEQYLTALGQGSGGGGGAAALADLVDVALSNPTNGQFLKYDGTHWVNAAVPTGVDMETVWAALASNDATHKIDNSHLNAIDATTLQGTSKADLFSALSSSWTTNLSVTIGGTTKTIPSLKADEADTLRTARTIWGQSFDGSDNVTGNLTLGTGNYLFLTGSTASSSSYIIGRSGGIAVAVGGSNNELYAFYSDKFYANAEIEAVDGVYSHGYVTALSDIRYKDVIGETCLNVKDIAGASLIRFSWKDGHDGGMTHVGGIAQEWKKMLPEAVREDKDGKLSMDYGVIAFTSVVSLARKVQVQAREIDQLKRENANLEKRLARIEKMFALTGEEEEDD